jgi:putative PIN family toxin of toxin-antitoxin system
VVKKAQELIRVVLDTNILLSALLFKGRLSRIVDLWKEGAIKPFFSRETFEEFRTALGYPKFSLKAHEVKAILEETLPYFEVVGSKEKISGVCKDPDDDKFISCALAASAEYIVSGDKDLCSLKKYHSVKIISGMKFLKLFE